jgi:hypothetical protein
VRCIGLNKVGCPGNLVAVEFAPNGRGWSVLGEYGVVGAGGERCSAALPRSDACYLEKSANAQAIRDRLVEAGLESSAGPSERSTHMPPSALNIAYLYLLDDQAVDLCGAP